MEKGNTALILAPFLKGVEEGGAEVELYYTRKLRIHPCLGCFNCWLRTPGECVQKDDMEWLKPKIREADIRIYASPVYCYGITGQLKNLIDRMVSLASPFVEVDEGRTRHLPGEGEKPHKVVLVSNCGLWDMENFDLLVAQMKAMCQDPPGEYAGALLRPHGEALRAMRKSGAPVDDIFEAAYQAGIRLVKDGEITEDVLQTVSRELLPRETYVEMVNREFKVAMERP